MRPNAEEPIAEETRQHAPIFPPAYSAGDTTVYLFTDATSNSVPRLHRFVNFCVMTKQNVDGRALIAKTCVLRGLIAPCRLVSEINPISRNCAV